MCGPGGNNGVGAAVLGVGRDSGNKAEVCIEFGGNVAGARALMPVYARECREQSHELRFVPLGWGGVGWHWRTPCQGVQHGLSRARGAARQQECLVVAPGCSGAMVGLKPGPCRRLPERSAPAAHLCRAGHPGWPAGSCLQRGRRSGQSVKPKCERARGVAQAGDTDARVAGGMDVGKQAAWDMPRPAAAEPRAEQAAASPPSRRHR